MTDGLLAGKSAIAAGRADPEPLHTRTIGFDADHSRSLIANAIGTRT